MVAAWKRGTPDNVAGDDSRDARRGIAVTPLSQGEREAGENDSSAVVIEVSEVLRKEDRAREKAERRRG